MTNLFASNTSDGDWRGRLHRRTDVDGLLALHRAEVPDDRAAWAVDLLLHFATSTDAEQSTHSQAEDAGPDRLTWGFQVLINGILRTPRPEGKT